MSYYRRLPNTDIGRVEALRRAISMEGFQENGELVLSYRTIEDARQLIVPFDKARIHAAQTKEARDKFSRTYRPKYRMAQLYVNHFIQVLLMAVQRGEIKKEILPAYGLETKRMPDVYPETSLVEWGERIIRAEEARISSGGIPIYNPTIAKVKVHWMDFHEDYEPMVRLRENWEKAQEEVVRMRPAVDDLILDIWNQVGKVYAAFPWLEQVNRSARFGVVYYDRKDRERRRAERERLKEENRRKQMNLNI
mgnify:CR=1 FL=1